MGRSLFQAIGKQLSPCSDTRSVFRRLWPIVRASYLVKPIEFHKFSKRINDSGFSGWVGSVSPGAEILRNDPTYHQWKLAEINGVTNGLKTEMPFLNIEIINYCY